MSQQSYDAAIERRIRNRSGSRGVTRRVFRTEAERLAMAIASNVSGKCWRGFVHLRAGQLLATFSPYTGMSIRFTGAEILDHCNPTAGDVVWALDGNECAHLIYR